MEIFLKLVKPFFIVVLLITACFFIFFIVIGYCIVFLFAYLILHFALAFRSLKLKL